LLPETLYQRIEDDLFDIRKIKADVNLVVTHMNYMKGPITLYSKPDFINHIYASDQKDQMELFI
jgi:hypothetical protein